jgi:hypothetical protein
MKFGYARVSSNTQDYAAQVEAMEAAGCERIYSEKASGKSTNGRAEFARLMKVLKHGEVVTVVKLDRLARSSRDLRQLLSFLQKPFRVAPRLKLRPTRSVAHLAAVAASPRHTQLSPFQSATLAAQQFSLLPDRTSGQTQIDKLSLIFLSVGTCLRSLSCHASQMHLIGDAPLVIRNASFDISFINAELDHWTALKSMLDPEKVSTLSCAPRQFLLCQSLMERRFLVFFRSLATSYPGLLPSVRSFSDLPADLINREQQESDEFIRFEQRGHRLDMLVGVDSFDIHRAQHRQFFGNIDGEGRHEPL